MLTGLLNLTPGRTASWPGLVLFIYDDLFTPADLCVFLIQSDFLPRGEDIYSDYNEFGICVYHYISDCSGATELPEILGVFDTFPTNGLGYFVPVSRKLRKHSTSKV